MSKFDTNMDTGLKSDAVIRNRETYGENDRMTFEATPC